MRPPESGKVSPRRRRLALLEQLEGRRLLAAAPFNEDFTGFLATGFTPQPAAGQLDSDDWRVTGLSDGDGEFGGTYVRGESDAVTDFTKGVSAGDITSGGIYAFETGSGNTALGVQPTGSDFSPGTITLKIDNASSESQDRWNVSFDIFTLNNAARSNSLVFEYSTDGEATYNPVGVPAFETPEAADAMPTWQSSNHSHMINLINPVASGSSIFFRWTSDDVSGSGSRDEIAIDNVIVTSENTGVTPPDSSFVLLNEVLFDPPGADDPPGSEYIELRGDPNSRVPAGTFLVTIEGDASSGFPQNVGKVANIFDLSTLQFGSGGFIVIGQQGGGYTVDPGANAFISDQPGFGGLSFYSTDVTTLDQIENASNSLLLIQSTTPPSLSDDIDLNDDGVADGGTFAGWTVLDGISVLDDSSDTTENAYADLVFAANGTGTQVRRPAGSVLVNTGTSDVGYVARIGDSTGSTAADWVAGELTGARPNWALATGETFPSLWEGRPLDHIGASNASGPIANVLINELRISHSTLDNTSNNFVELYEANGDSGVSLNGLTLVVLTGQTDTGVPPNFTAGDISFAYDLSGGVTDENGFVLVADDGSAASLDPGDIVSNVDFFGSPQTFLVVSGFTGTVGSDLDPNDDGELDERPWSSVIDAVSLDDMDAAVVAQNYASTDSLITGTTIQPTAGAVGFAPAAVARVPDGAPTFIVLGGDDTFTDDTSDTPGSTNAPVYELVETFESTGVVEGGVSDSFTFVLTVEPTSDVTVTFNITDGETTVAPTTLTFSPGSGANAWNTPQTVDVTAVVDSDSEGTHQGIISLAVTSSDPVFEGLSVPDLEVTIADALASPPDAVINEVRISSAVDDNLSNNFVEIYHNPGTATDLSGLTVLVISETFSPGEINFAVPLDGLSTNADGFALLADDGAQPVSDLAGGILSIPDFDLFGSPSTILLVREFTGSAGQDLDVDNDGTLDFTPWTKLDAVTLEAGESPGPGYDSSVVLTTGTNNAAAGVRRIADGTGVFDLLAFDDNSADTPGATNVLPPGVRLIDLSGEVIVSESGLTDSFEIVLNSEPESDVTITLNPDAQLDLGVGVDTDVVLTFTQANWFVPQPVTVSAFDDAADEGDHQGQIAITVGGTDAAYTALVVPDQTVEIVDNDNANHVVVINEILHDSGNGPAPDGDANGDGVFGSSDDEFVEILNTGASSVDLSGWTISDSFTERHIFADGTFLAPGQAVVVFGGGTLQTYGNSLAATASTGTLGLSSADTVTLTDGERIIDVHSWTSGEGVNLSLARIPDGSGDFIEDTFLFFTPGFRNDAFNDMTEFDVGASAIVSPTQVEVVEGGPTGTFDVRLTGTPSNSVMVTLSPSNAEIDLGAGAGVAVTLDFTVTNAGDPQSVTVTAVDDMIDEGVHASMILVTTVSADTDFDALPTPPVNVSVIDDDGTANAAGDIVITEIMQNPGAVGDNQGEYFEIFNATDAAIDVNGWVISDAGSDTHTIANGGPLTIAPGGYLVLGRNADVSTNGGVSVDYQYADFFLANGDDEVILTDASGVIIDRVDYDGGPMFPDPNGASMELVNGLTGDLSLANDLGSNWQTSSSVFGAGDSGTPGAANSSGVVAPEFITVSVNDGTSAQRSMITSITVEFSQAVVLSGTPFVLTNTTDNTVVDLSTATIDVQGNVVTITFGTGASLQARPIGNTLTDGNYRLDIIGSQVRAAADGDTQMINDAVFGDEATDLFFRLFGDANGDRTLLGGGVDGDLAQFGGSFGTATGASGYLEIFDADGNGFIVPGVDLDEFATNFGLVLPNP